MRKFVNLLAVFSLATSMVFVFAAPASATIHEIVASFCADTHEVSSPTGDIHNPPGLTPTFLGGTSAADNVAQPLISSGAITVETADGTETLVDPATGEPNGTVPEGATILVINETTANVKLVGSGLFFFDPADNVYVEIGQPNPDFAAFANCANLAG